MIHIFKDLLVMRKGHIVNVTVLDGFHGDIKIIKNRLYKWLVEIVDVSMCYPQQVQLKPGEQMWVCRKELFRDNHKCVYKSKRQFDDSELSF